MRFNPMQFGSFAPQIHREDPIACRLWAARLRQGYGALAPAPKAFGAGAGDEARTRDVHLGKVVLYQLSYTRSFERDNNVQPTAPRNLLIASERLKIVESKSDVYCIL